MGKTGHQERGEGEEVKASDHGKKRAENTRCARNCLAANATLLSICLCNKRGGCMRRTLPRSLRSIAPGPPDSRSTGYFPTSKRLTLSMK
jgi:hypothetical protein